MSAMSGFKRPEPVEGESTKWTIQKLLTAMRRMKHLMKNKQSKDMSDKKENKFDSKPLMIRRIKMIQSPGILKKIRMKRNHIVKAKQRNRRDNDVVEFEKTWNVDFEELKKKNSERQ
jgi:hypothetical protein